MSIAFVISLTQMLARLLVCDVEHTYFHFGMWGLMFVLYLFS